MLSAWARFRSLVAAHPSTPASRAVIVGLIRARDIGPTGALLSAAETARSPLARHTVPARTPIGSGGSVQPWERQRTYPLAPKSSRHEGESARNGGEGSGKVRTSHCVELASAAGASTPCGILDHSRRIRASTLHRRATYRPSSTSCPCEHAAAQESDAWLRMRVHTWAMGGARAHQLPARRCARRAHASHSSRRKPHPVNSASPAAAAEASLPSSSPSESSEW